MEDIGTKDDWVPARRVFILSGVPEGMGVSTENNEEPTSTLCGFAGLRFPCKLMVLVMSHEGSREETIFHAIMGLATPQERARYLEQACGDDRGLRQRVEALLNSAQKPEDFLERPVVESMRSAAEASALEAQGSQVFAGVTEKPGDRIGPYKLLERIGEGGCGVVYMA